MRSLPVLILALFAAWFATTGRAADPPAQQPDELATAAKLILTTHCHRCHGENGAAEGGFNTVTDRNRLVARKKIVPGDAGKSLLLRRVAAGEMPPDEEKTRPTAEDVATLTRWIKAGAPDWAPAGERRFIPVDEEARLVREDLAHFKDDPQRQGDVKYFTLTPLYNAGYSEDELQTVRLAFAKLLNSLSWQPDILLPRPINSERTIYRLDLRAFGWNRLHWELITRLGPYHMAYRPDKNFHPEYLPVRADWFVADGSRPPRYHEVAGLPLTVAELEARLKVAAAADIQAGKVIRAGFNQSGVSLHNRLIERHDGAFGYYWKSYDFASSRGRRNLFTYPLGPGASAAGVTFQHDGGEIIFRLPNGLQGYFLTDGRGNRLDRGPTDIVSDPKHPLRVVENGVSCMSCHSAGFIDKADQIRPLAEPDNAPYSKDDRDAILRLYPKRDAFEAALKADAADYRAALTKLGIRPGGAEPIFISARRFDAELDLRQAAAELWVTPEELTARLRAMPAWQSGELVALLAPGGTVKRDTFEGRFQTALFRVQPRVESTAQAPRTPAIGKATRTGVVKPGDLFQLAEQTPISYRLPPISVNPTVDPKFRLIVAVTPDGRRLKLFDLKTGELRHTLADQARVLAVAFAPDGSILAASGEDQFIRFFDLASGREVARTTEVGRGGGRLEYWAIAFSADGKELAAAGRDGIVRFIDPATGQTKHTIPEPNTMLSWLAYSADGTQLLNADARRGATVRATDLKTGKSRQVEFELQGWVTSMRFSPDGKFFCVTFSNNTIRLRDGATLDEIAVERVAFEGSKEWASTVRTAVFSADGKHLAAAHTEGVISLWSTAGLRPLGTFRAYSGDLLRTLRFSPDGKRLASGASDGGVRVWDVEAMVKD
jgi:mono/diheme cytochrome c family protein